MKYTYRLLGLSLVLFAGSMARASLRITEDGFKGTSYQGDWRLKEDPQVFLSLGLTRFGEQAAGHLLTTTIEWPRPDGSKGFSLIPDLAYPVRDTANPADPLAMGVRLIPVSSEFVQGNDLYPGPKLIDGFLTDIFYGDPASNKQIYAFVTHNTSYDNFYEDMEQLAHVKVQTSSHHVSTYYGANQNSRRGMLYGNAPDNNVFIAAMKGVPQDSFNTNAAIWAKLYYQNPDGYQFASDYEFDWLVGSTLEETLAFATGWVDRAWVRKDLNKKIVDTIGRLQKPNSDFDPNSSYYNMLRQRRQLALYCFEGVANMLYVAMNIPLTRDYFKRIWGDVRGSEMFDATNSRFQEIMRSELGTPQMTPDQKGEFSLEGPRSRFAPALARMKALWDRDLSNANQFTGANPLFPDRDATGNPIGYAANATRDQEMRKVGVSLPWAPETTSEILRDFIVMYAPFHKVGGARSARFIIGFQEDILRRTGIDKAVFQSYSSKIIKRILSYESFLMKKRLDLAVATGQKTSEQATATYAGYRAQTVAAVLEKAVGNEELSEEKLQEAIDNPQVVNVSQADFARIGAKVWDAFYAELNSRDNAQGKSLLEEINDIPINTPDIIEQGVKGTKFVKYYQRPGLPQVIAQGIHPTNENVKIIAATTVINPEYVVRQESTDGDSHKAYLRNLLQSFTASQEPAQQ